MSLKDNLLNWVLSLFRNGGAFYLIEVDKSKVAIQSLKIIRFQKKITLCYHFLKLFIKIFFNLIFVLYTFFKELSDKRAPLTALKIR